MNIEFCQELWMLKTFMEINIIFPFDEKQKIEFETSDIYKIEFKRHRIRLSILQPQKGEIETKGQNIWNNNVWEFSWNSKT